MTDSMKTLVSLYAKCYAFENHFHEGKVKGEHEVFGIDASTALFHTILWEHT